MATNMYLKITGPDIKGESKDSKHADWIEVLSSSHGVSQPTSATVSTGGGRTVERCHHQDFTPGRCYRLQRRPRSRASSVSPSPRRSSLRPSMGPRNGA